MASVNMSIYVYKLFYVSMAVDQSQDSTMPMKYVTRIDIRVHK